MMNRRIHVISLVFVTLMSLGWLCWDWHDQTFAGQGYRRQQPADHVAAVLFAVARIVFSAGVIEVVKVIQREDAR